MLWLYFPCVSEPLLSVAFPRLVGSLPSADKCSFFQLKTLDLLCDVQWEKSLTNLKPLVFQSYQNVILTFWYDFLSPICMQTQSTTEMNSLSTCVNKLVTDGYSINFKVDEQGLVAVEEGKHYKPDQVHIKNFFRFEGASDPADNAILYAIELDNGKKGTLIDAYGSYSDASITKFIKQVEDMEKKTPNENH